MPWAEGCMHSGPGGRALQKHFLMAELGWVGFPRGRGGSPWGLEAP